MRNPIFSLLFLLLGMGSLHAQDCGPTPPHDGKVYAWCYTPNEGTNWNTGAYKAYIINGVPFRLLFPKGYDSTAVSAKQYPLVIMLHGLGMGGKDNNYPLKIGGEAHLEALSSGRFDGFVMVPQAAGELWTSGERAAILTFVKQALLHLPVDPLKVQLEGYSAGGTSAWILAYENPLVFASAIVMSSANGNFARNHARVLKYTPIWHAQGGRDTQPSPAAGESVAREFRAAGANYTYQYYHELGHGTWEAMYQEEDFFPFLMRSSMLTIHAQHFKYNFCTGEPVSGTLGIRKGFQAYEWRKDGKQFGSNSHEVKFSETGSYTVRVKRNGEWSQWSEPLRVRRLAPTPTPVLRASGPTALPTLDGRTTVTLRAPPGQQAYVWSDGSELDSLVVSKAGAYSVAVTEPRGCASADSAPLQVTYNAVGVLPAPAALHIETESESDLFLRWTDKSTSESGFELYRAQAEEGAWTLVAQLPKNTTTFKDKGLNAHTRYYYALRSVNAQGGSEYSRGSGKTYADSKPPGIPAKLEISKTSPNSIGLLWQASADLASESGAITYEIFVNNILIGQSTQPHYLVRGLPEKRVFTFRVRARDSAGNTSDFSNQATAGTFINGLYYTYYEGRVTSVHDISLLKAKAAGRISTFSINRENRAKDGFAFAFEGHITIPTTGTYTFYTTSDEGSTLSIDGFEVVNNDKKHSSQERSGTLELTAGLHEIRVLYFKEGGDAGMLEVNWKGPGFEKQPLPETAFTEAFDLPQPPPTPTAVTANALDAAQIKVEWRLESSDSTGIEIYRSLQEAGPFVLAKTVAGATASYVDRGLTAATTYYYQLRATNKNGESAVAALTAAGSPLRATTPPGDLPAPKGLLAQRTAGQNALLKWADGANAGNHFEVWRATDAASFTKISKAPLKGTTFTDYQADSAKPYQYRVRAVKGNESSGWSNVAVLSNENKTPVLAGLEAALTAPEGKTTEILFDLYDPDGDTLQLISSYLPPFASIVMEGERKAKLVLTPAVKDIGTYRGIQLTATDGMLETDVTLTIRVQNSEKTAVYINLGQESVAPAPWNNTNTFGGQSNKLLLENLLDEHGAATGYSISLLDPWTASRAYGETSGNNGGIYPDAVSSSAYIIEPGKTARLQVSGLKPGLRYNFVFFGSSIYKSHNGSTIYSIGNQQVRLAVQSNLDKTVQLNGILPDARGEVMISISGADDATKGGYLNALVIEQYPESGPMLRPSRISAHAVSKTEVELSWADNTHQEAGFEIWRKRLPSGVYQRVTTTAPDASSYVDAGLASNTAYEYKIRAAAGSRYSGFSETRAATTLLYKLLINANYTRNTGAPWANLDQRPTTGYTWYNFKNQEQQHTGINLRLDQNFSGNNAYGPEAGGGGIYPDDVIKTFYYTEVGTVAKLRFYGLDDALTYNFRFFGASAFEGGESGVTAYKIGDKRVTLDVEHNIRQTAVIRNVKSSDGSLLLTVEAGPFARYGFLNALELEVRDGFKELDEGIPGSLFSEGDSLLQEKLNQITGLYPNPTLQELNIKFLAGSDGACYIQIIDITGRLVHRLQVDALQGENLFNLDLNTTPLSKGMYLLRISAAGFESKSVRFIKQ